MHRRNLFVHRILVFGQIGPATEAAGAPKTESTCAKRSTFSESAGKLGIMKALFAALICLSAFAFSAVEGFAETPQPSIPTHDPKYGVYPIAYREIITKWLSERLLDAGSAKIEFSEPQAVDVRVKGGQTFSGFSVEFRVNSRNKFGMYTGFQKHRVLIRNGEILSANRVKN